MSKYQNGFGAGIAWEFCGGQMNRVYWGEKPNLIEVKDVGEKEDD